MAHIYIIIPLVSLLRSERERDSNTIASSLPGVIFIHVFVVSWLTSMGFLTSLKLRSE
jgi:hypothetical protein